MNHRDAKREAQRIQSNREELYFSRDYKKLFGAPPQRDIARLGSNLEL